MESIDFDCAYAQRRAQRPRALLEGVLPDLLFVYGTLHPDRAPAEIASEVCRFQLVGKGFVRGRLHRLADYPALHLEQGGSPVPGEVFRVPADAWPALDAYEGYAPGDPEGSRFLRKRTDIGMTDGSRQECWVYVYAHGLP